MYIDIFKCDACSTNDCCPCTLIVVNPNKAKPVRCPYSDVQEPYWILQGDKNE